MKEPTVCRGDVVCFERLGAWAGGEERATGQRALRVLQGEVGAGECLSSVLRNQ